MDLIDAVILGWLFSIFVSFVAGLIIVCTKTRISIASVSIIVFFCTWGFFFRVYVDAERTMGEYIEGPSEGKQTYEHLRR